MKIFAHITIIFSILVNIYSFKVYDKYNNTTGTVIAVNYDRNNISYVTVRTKEVTRTINYGYNKAKVGDTITNKINYIPILGIFGNAYCIYPYQDLNLFLSAIHISLLLTLIGCFIFENVNIFKGLYDHDIYVKIIEILFIYFIEIILDKAI